MKIEIDASIDREICHMNISTILVEKWLVYKKYDNPPI
jgi:hypothetical protein